MRSGREQEEERRGDEERGEEEEKEDEKEEDEEEATDIKSNNPHLAGGEIRQDPFRCRYFPPPHARCNRASPLWPCRYGLMTKGEL